MNSTHAKLMLIINRIKEQRMTLNYTQQYVAGKLNISQNAYSKLENGQTNFTVERLYQIAEVLHTEVTYLLT